MDMGDHAQEARLARARAEVALVALIAALAGAVLLILLFTETRLNPKAVAAGVVCGAFGLPVVLLKGPLATWRAAGLVTVAALVGGMGWVATDGNLAVIAAAVAAGMAGAVAFYHIRTNTAYRPRLLGEKR
jgi:hypothetical protein